LLYLHIMKERPEINALKTVLEELRKQGKILLAYLYVGDILDCPKKDNIGAGSFGKQASKCVACQTEDERKQSGAAV